MRLILWIILDVLFVSIIYMAALFAIYKWQVRKFDKHEARIYMKEFLERLN